MAPRTINVLSLCSGGGGLDAGLKLALPDARTVCYVEREITAVGVLAKGIKTGWLDDAPVWSDLSTFDYEPWRDLVDIIIGGYPCQPFSYAGRNRGVDDPRHLWPRIEVIVKSIQPAICFFENVNAHLVRGYYDIVRPSLASMGYFATEGLFTAAEVGAPHIRQRLFILAVANATGPRRAGAKDGRADSGNESENARRREQPERASVVVADSERSDLLQAPTGRTNNTGRAPATRASTIVALAASEGRPARHTERSGDSREAKPHRPSNENMVDPDVEGREGWYSAFKEHGHELPAWSPSPTDAAGWDAYLSRAGFAPTTTRAESILRGGIDGMAYRTDRLRIGGNGVVPAVAAKAFTYLANSLLTY